jgi:hypothetical protein
MFLVNPSCLKNYVPCVRDLVLIEVVELVFVLVLNLIYNGWFVFWYVWQV